MLALQLLPAAAKLISASLASRHAYLQRSSIAAVLSRTELLYPD